MGGSDVEVYMQVGHRYVLHALLPSPYPGCKVNTLGDHSKRQMRRHLPRRRYYLVLQAKYLITREYGYGNKNCIKINSVFTW